MKYSLKSSFARWVLVLFFVILALTIVGGFMALVIWLSPYRLELKLADTLRLTVCFTLLIRCGIFAMIACAYPMLTLPFLPLTLDPSRWYFNASLTCILVFIGMAVYAFFTSIGGAKLFKEGLFGDE